MTDQPHCPVCSSVLTRPRQRQLPYADVERIWCERCGEYLLTGLAESGELIELSAADRIALSRTIRLHNDATRKALDEPISPKNLPALVARGAPARGPTAQLDEFVLFVADRTTNLGDQTAPEPAVLWAARLGLPSADAFDVLARACRDEGLIDYAIRGGTQPVLALTMSGWRRAEAQRQMRRPQAPPAPATTESPSKDSSMTAPKVFISYSWDSEPHKAWVKDLATRLRNDGVAVVLDQWHLALGDQLPHFMEKSVRESDYVLLVCTPNFKMKADERKGGVGYEGHVITAEVFGGADHRKFVPLLREGTWGDAAPSWMKGKLFTDLRGDPYGVAAYESLLQHLHDDREAAPPVGTYTPRNKTSNP